MRKVNLDNKPEKYHKWYQHVRKDITRYDYNNKGYWTHGWYVRINWLGKKYGKVFHDKCHHGPLGSLRAAKLWRAKTHNKIGKPLTNKKITNYSKGKLGKGLYHVPNYKQKIFKSGKMRSYVRDVIVVTWPIGNGKTNKTTVSVDKYGYDDAVRRARKIHEINYNNYYNDIENEYFM